MFYRSREVYSAEFMYNEHLFSALLSVHLWSLHGKNTFLTRKCRAAAFIKSIIIISDVQSTSYQPQHNGHCVCYGRVVGRRLGGRLCNKN